MKILSYLKARLGERSTWAALGAGVTGAAALAAPWAYVFVALAAVGVLVPSGKPE
jgi:hypothetical protein